MHENLFTITLHRGSESIYWIPDICTPVQTFSIANVQLNVAKKLLTAMKKCCKIIQMFQKMSVSDKNRRIRIFLIKIFFKFFEIFLKFRTAW